MPSISGARPRGNNSNRPEDHYGIALHDSESAERLAEVSSRGWPRNPEFPLPLWWRTRFAICHQTFSRTSRRIADNSGRCRAHLFRVVPSRASYSDRRNRAAATLASGQQRGDAPSLARCRHAARQCARERCYPHAVRYRSSSHS